MQKYSLLIAVLIFWEFTNGQNPARSILPQGPPPVPIFISDITGKPFIARDVEDVEGSPFLFDNWNWGALKLRNGKYAKDVSLLFNVYNNKLYFKRDDQQMELIDPVHEFILGYQDEGDSVAVVYRAGYPPIDKNTPETFYELLADGRVQLLKYRYKTIQEFKSYNQPIRKKFVDKEQLYALLPEGKMVKINKNKEAVLQAMAEYGNAIRKISEEKDLRLRNEDAIVQLVVALNQQEK